MLRDTGLLFRMELLPSLRNPGLMAVAMTQPLFFLLLFGPLMEKLVGAMPGFPPGDSWTVFTPALIIQLALFSASFAGFTLLSDRQNGLLERLRVTPASAVALLLGRTLTNTVHTVVQSLLIIGIAVLLFDLTATPVGVGMILLVAALLSVALASASQALALVLRNEEAFLGLINTVLMPLLLLSGMLIPITTGLAPQWLYTLSRLNPLTHVVDAGRAGFRGDLAFSALSTGMVLLVVMAAASVWWGARTLRRDDA
ncbi:ABC transporter permease [Saccharothrix lopnurensis]|uniref:Transport permease protein n=1 Tax=Saccharothrix lopnurensis TaxID=1670621 RepID=A0ABW1P881_9PSEU